MNLDGFENGSCEFELEIYSINGDTDQANWYDSTNGCVFEIMQPSFSPDPDRTIDDERIKIINSAGRFTVNSDGRL